MHVLRDCNEAMKFWSPIINQNIWKNSLDYVSCIGLNGTLEMKIFEIRIALELEDRNELVFDQHSNLRQNLLFQIVSQVQMVVETILILDIFNMHLGSFFTGVKFSAYPPRIFVFKSFQKFSHF
jgi:hypothetical protein